MEISAKPALAIIVVLTAAIIYISSSMSITGFVTNDVPTGLQVSVCCQSSDVQDKCTSKSICLDCTVQDECGWCKKTNKCIEGFITGSYSTDCYRTGDKSYDVNPYWAWSDKSCPTQPAAAECPYSCMSEFSCAKMGGTTDRSFSCPSYYNSDSGLSSMPQGCCRLGSYQNVYTGEMTSILLDYSAKTKASVGASGIFGWFDLANIYVLMVDSGDMNELDDDVALYKVLLDNLRSGRSVDGTISFYKQFVTNGQINSNGKKYLDEKYDKLTTIFSKEYQECEAKQLAGKLKPGEYCTYPIRYSTGLAITRGQEEEFMKSIASTSGLDYELISALKNYDKKTSAGQSTAEEESRIFYYLGRKLQGKGAYDQGNSMAIEMYTAVADNYPSSSVYADALTRKNQMKSLGFQAKVFGKGLLIGFIGLDNLVPVPGPGKAKALRLLGKIPGIKKFTTAHGDDALRTVLKTEGLADNEIDEFLQLSKKVDADTASASERLKLATLIRNKAGIAAAKGLKDIVPKLSFLSDLDGYDLWKASEGSSTGTRWVVFVDMDGVKQPFYKSAGGTSGKLQGGWHPFFGFAENDMPGISKGWFLKSELDASGYGLNGARYKQITDQLDAALPGYWAQGDIPSDMVEIVNNAKSVNSIGFTAFNSKTFGRQIIDRIAIDEQLLRAYGVPKARGFDELYSILNSWDRLIHGSNGETYTVLEMKNLIQDVRMGNKPLSAITRTGGLRDKVAQLLGSYITNMRLIVSGALSHEQTYIESVIGKDQISIWSELAQNLGIRSEVKDVSVSLLSDAGAFKRAFKVTAKTASDGEKVFVIKVPRGGEKIGPIDLKEFENTRLLGEKGVGQRVYTRTPVTRPYHLDNSLRTVVLVEEFLPGDVTDRVLASAIASGDSQKLGSIFRSLGDLSGNLWKKTVKRGADGTYTGLAIGDNHLGNSITDLSGGSAVTKYVDAGLLDEMNFENFMSNEIGIARAIGDSTSLPVVLDKALEHSADFLDGMWPHLLESNGGDVVKAKKMLMDAAAHFNALGTEAPTETSRQFYRKMSLKISDFANTK